MEAILAAAGEALGTLMYRVGAAMYGRAIEVPAPDVELGSDLIEDHRGRQIIVTDAQARAISRLIATPEVTALVQNHLFVSSVRTKYKYALSWLEEIEAAFNHLFESSVADMPPSSGASALIWDLIVRNAQLVAPPQDGMERLASKDLEALIESTGSLSVGRAAPPPRYIRLIVDITRSSEKIFSIRTLCSDICRASFSATSQMQLEHTQEHHRFSYDQLYIERDLTPISQVKERRIVDLTTNPAPGVGLVILGHPGAGKSTLTARLGNVLASRPEKDFAPILVRCKTLNVDNELFSLTDHIVRAANVEPGIQAEREGIEALMALGRAVLIFDGIDEVADVQLRRRLIDAIEKLATTYPLMSVLCTTRKVGYEAARFSSSRFDVVQLEEYTDAQVKEYTRRWFSLMGRPEVDAMAFIRESAEIEEIRRNPLMLSLLCTLYRVRGYIPMNRLDVYKACADLLFFSWDALRRVPQPVDHRRYGHTLMEELADLYFKFPSASAGVEEKQLTKLISVYFRDTAGVEERDAERRAAEFLEFCAGRAWLLTAAGYNARGQRVFAFTHRTFMEFYAAEAVVRRASSMEEVLTTIVDVYSKNPSSVLPDLIVEAYEEKSHRGAESLLRALMRIGAEGRRVRAGSQLPLCLRILNSTPVGAPLVKDVLRGAFDSWAATPRTEEMEGDYGSFIALLRLYRDPRNICISMLGGRAGADGDRTAYRLAFVKRWCRTWFLGETEVFQQDWGDLVEDIERDDLAALKASPDPVLRSYLVARGLLGVARLRYMDQTALVLDCFGEAALGLVSAAALRTGVTRDATDVDRELVARSAAYLRRRILRVDEGIAMQLSYVIADLVSELPTFDPRAGMAPGTTDVLVWISCVLAESSTTGLHPFHDAVSGLLPEDLLRRILLVRQLSIDAQEFRDEDLVNDGAWPQGVRPEASTVTSKEVLRRTLVNEVSRIRAEAATHCPRWIVRWATGRVSLLL